MLKQRLILKNKDKITIVNVTPQIIYGYQAHGIINYLTRELTKKTKQINLTHGEQKRDFIHIEDLLSAFDTIINNLKNFTFQYKSFEVGNGLAKKIKEIAILVKYLTGNKHSDLCFGAKQTRKFEPDCLQANLEEISKLGWKPKIDLEYGIRKLIKLS